MMKRQAVCRHLVRGTDVAGLGSSLLCLLSAEPRLNAPREKGKGKGRSQLCGHIWEGKKIKLRVFAERQLVVPLFSKGPGANAASGQGRILSAQNAMAIHGAFL